MDKLHGGKLLVMAAVAALDDYRIGMQIGGQTFWIWFKKNDLIDTRGDDMFSAHVARKRRAIENSLFDATAQTSRIRES